jgi:iron complex transport system permease protein
MSRWLMGTLDVGGYAPLAAAVPLLIVAFAMFATLPRPLDLLSLGADAASARGVDVVAAERAALVSASLATGAAVSISGPIGFVGIIVPHLVRLLVGSDHRLVLPASILFGASFVIICDLVARTMFSPLEVPVGVVTALVGGPFFLWLLLRHT